MESRESVCVLSRQSGRIRCVWCTIIASVLGILLATLLGAAVGCGHAAAESHYVSARVVAPTGIINSGPHYSVSEIDEGYAVLNGIMTVEIVSDWCWQLNVEVTPLSWAPGAQMPDPSVLQLRFRSLSDSVWSAWVQPNQWVFLGSEGAVIQFQYRVDVRGIRPDPGAPAPGIRGGYVFDVEFIPSLRDPDS